MIKRICIYCGSKLGHDPAFKAAAVELATAMAARGFGAITGGGHVGLMGVIADTMLAGGGEVIGVIPEQLRTRELAHEGITIEIVDSMHARKARMADLADAFIALPGGYGTFEELFEMITWSQLGIHVKPIGVLNTTGYYEPLHTLIAHAIDHGFIRPEHRDLFLIRDTVPDLLHAITHHHPPSVRPWGEK